MLGSMTHLQYHGNLVYTCRFRFGFKMHSLDIHASILIYISLKRSSGATFFIFKRKTDFLPFRFRKLLYLDPIKYPTISCGIWKRSHRRITSNQMDESLIQCLKLDMASILCQGLTTQGICFKSNFLNRQLPSSSNTHNTLNQIKSQYFDAY